LWIKGHPQKLVEPGRDNGLDGKIDYGRRANDHRYIIRGILTADAVVQCKAQHLSAIIVRSREAYVQARDLDIDIRLGSNAQAGILQVCTNYKGCEIDNQALSRMKVNSSGGSVLHSRPGASNQHIIDDDSISLTFPIESQIDALPANWSKLRFTCW
jgi:hypothetical protein